MTVGYTLQNQECLIKLSENQKTNRNWTLVYISRGVGMYILEDSLRSLNEGDIIVLPPNVAYSFASGDLGDEYNINLSATVLRFDKAWLDALIAAFPVLSEMVLKIKELRNPLTVKGPKWIELSSLLDDIMVCPPEEQPLKVFSILAQISTPSDFILIKDVYKRDVLDISERRSRIDRYLECNYSRKVTLEEVSSYVGMSRTYFSIFFKTHYQEGFSDYVTRLRVDKASVLLMNTDKPIPDIAKECGFKTVQYFTRAFKKVKGITPGTFRKR